MVVEDGVDEAAQGFGGGFASGEYAADEVDELVLAEVLAGGRAGLGDAVGVEQDAVARFQLDPVHGPGGLVAGAEAKRQLGCGLQCPRNDVVGVDQKRRGVAGIDPGKLPGVDIQVREDAGEQATGLPSVQVLWSKASPPIS